MISQQVNQLFRRWIHRLSRPGQLAPSRRNARLTLDTFEDRIVPATLPAPYVTDTATVGAGFNPQAALDPLNPNRIALVTTDGLSIDLLLSTDGGTSFGQAFTTSRAPGPINGTLPLPTSNPANRAVDPLIANSSANTYTNASSPSITFGRDGSIYIVSLQHNASKSSGAVVVHRFMWMPDGSFSQVDLDPNKRYGPANQGNILYQWVNQDPAFNPTIAVDNNLPIYVDPITGLTRTDTMIEDRLIVSLNNAVNPGDFTAASILNITDPRGNVSTSGNVVRVTPIPLPGNNPTDPTNLFEVVLQSGRVPLPGELYAINFTVAATGVLGQASTIATADGQVSKGVYVAWNTNATRPNGTGQTAGFNANAILASASSDRGFNFSNPLPVNGLSGSTTYSGYTGQGAGAPRIEFSATGELMFLFSGVGNGNIRIDTSRPDGGIAATQVVEVYEQIFAGGIVADATTSGDEIARVTEFPGSNYALGATPPPPTYNTINIDPVVFGTGSDWDVDLELAMSGNDLSYNRVVVEVRFLLNGVTPTTRTLTLFNNRRASVTGNNTTGGIGANDLRPGLAEGTTLLGVTNANFNQYGAPGVVFSDQAPRVINDTDYTNPTYTGANLDPLIGNYRPEAGTLASLFNGLNAATINAGLEIRLIVTDFNDETTSTTNLRYWSIKISSRISRTGFGSDESVATGLANGPDNIHPSPTPLPPTVPTTPPPPPPPPPPPGVPPPPAPAPTSPSTGIGGTASFAVDDHVGSLSPYAGRIYVAYTAGSASNPNVFVASRNPNDSSWTRVQVNDDSFNDNFTGGNRAQFMPSITVDPVTGTVVVMWYDARFDANNTRAATYVATSIDGGLTWSTQEYTSSLLYRPYLNDPKTAVDVITGQTTFIEPLPTDFPGLGANGAGNFQSILAYGGRLNPFWTGNTGGGGASIFTATASISAGPRIVSSDMGRITEDAVAIDNRAYVSGVGGDLDRQLVTEAGFVYNNTFVVGGAADGVRQLDGFVIEFDRPIHVPSFSINDIRVVYLSPTDSRNLLDDPDTPTFDPAASNLVQVARIIALNPGAGPGESTRFFVEFATPQTRVGTYSYAILPGVHDRLARPPEPANFIPGPAGYTPVGGRLTFNSTPGSVFIPDQGTESSSITVPALGNPNQVMTDIQVAININHSQVADLRISLVGPDGTQVILTDRQGVGLNYSNTRFRDSAGQAFPTGAAPYNNVFRPQELLTVFNGTLPQGQWTLVVEDLVGTNSGLINSWNISYQPASLANNTLIEGNRVIDGVIPIGSPITTTLTPTFGPFNASPAQAIPNGTGLVAESTINVPDMPANLSIEDIEVTLNITHENVSDLTVLLIDPTGVQWVLVNGNATGANFTNTRFASYGTAQLHLGTAPFTGTFRAVQHPSPYTGFQTTGNWTLRVIDNITGADTGTFDSWSLNFPLTVPDYSATQNSRTYDIVIADLPPVPGLAPAFQVIEDVNIALDIDHTNVSDLKVTLIAPDGTEVVLVDRRGGTSDNIVATFDDSAANPVGTAASLLGTFIPEQLLDVLNGKLAGGIWQLRIEDNGLNNGAQALLNSFAITIQPGYYQPAGNPMDQDADGIAGETFDDIFATPRSQLTSSQHPDDERNGRPFSLPYDPQTLPLIVPGPHLDTAVRVFEVEGDTLTNSVRVAFDREVLPGSFTGADIVVLNGPNGGFRNTVDQFGNPVTVFRVVAIDAGGTPTSQPTRYFQIFHEPPGSSPLQIQIKDLFAYELVVRDVVPYNVVLNSASSTLTVTFDRVIDAATFTPADVLRMTGPSGVITGPFTVTPVGGSTTRTFEIGFPTQLQSGYYSIEFSSDIATPMQINGAVNKIDSNFNAGVSVLFGGTGQANATNSYPSTSAPVPIPANGTATMSLTITDPFIINQLIGINRSSSQLISLGLNITHQFVPNLQAKLIAPDGTEVQLFTNLASPGTNKANFTNTIFDDLGTTAIQQGSAPFTSTPISTFTPQLPLSTLNGIPFNANGGVWTLEVTNTGGFAGTINSWSLTLPYAVPSTGLGETIADRFSTGFRIFVQDPTNPLSKSVWTPVGPTPATGTDEEGGTDATNYAANSGKVLSVNVDPSDPSGNTVYIGAGTGGVWKTTNFLTTDPAGPTWIPLTDFGPTGGVSVTRIELIPRNNDPSQTIVLALTSGNSFEMPTGANVRGIGILRSLDAGLTWELLDSFDNRVATSGPGAGQISPISAASRGHQFVNTAGFDLIVDPTPNSSGEYILYLAVQGTNANGVYRSNDTGRSWTLVQAGAATDLQLAAGSVGSNGNLQILYAAFTDQGVLFTSQADSAVSMSLLGGGIGNNLIRFDPQDVPVPVAQPDGANPLANRDRIAIAAPVLTNNPLANVFYQDWLYATVQGNGGVGILYMTKDRGRNWTKIDIPSSSASPFVSFSGNNNETNTDTFFGAPHALSIVVDPNNPNIVYLGSERTIRVDTTVANTPQTYVNGDFSKAGGSTVGSFTPGGQLNNPNDPNGDPYETDFLNLSRDPLNPFIANATLTTSGFSIPQLPFANNGENARWMPFDDIKDDAQTTFQLFSMVDPITGRTRLISVTDQGIFSAVDGAFTRIGNGEQLYGGIGFSSTGDLNRNGNLQIAQFFSGAVQPSQLAADIAGSLFYGMAINNGYPVSTGSVLGTGDTQGLTGSLLEYAEGTGVAVDPTGSGTAYQYRDPNDLGDPSSQSTDFFRVLPPNQPHTGDGSSRTNGLGNHPDFAAGGFSTSGGFAGYFAVNHVDNRGLLVSSTDGTIFRTTDQGVNWDVVGELGSYARALAFGALSPTSKNNFLYAGTISGNIFYTQTGGDFINISAGLAGSGMIMQIIPNPQYGENDVFAVAANGVYYNADVTAPGSTWTNITGNLFSIQREMLGTGQFLPALQPGGLTTLAADWRFAIPGGPGGTFPILYVGGIGGVFRSMNFGVSWEFFPAAQTVIDPNTGATLDVPDGGFLPNTLITDLDLSLGNIDPNTGLPQQSGGLNLLLATTFGRGQFAIRVDPTLPNNVQPVSGPRVTSVLPFNGTTQTNINPDRIQVTFSGPVNEQTFEPDDVSLIGPNGPITILAVNKISVPDSNNADPRNLYEIVFAPQSDMGSYDLVIGPDLSDPAGNLMDQNNNQVNGEPEDQYAATLLFNVAAQGNLDVVLSPSGTVQAGQTITVTVTARTLDNTGVLTTYNGDVQISSSDPQLQILSSLPLTLTNGVGSFEIQLQSTGVQTVVVTAVSQDLNPENPAEQVTVTPGAVTSLTVDVDTTTVTASAADNVQVTVRAFDFFGNLATNYSGQINLISSDLQAGLPPAFLLQNGVATVGVALRTRGTQTISATTDPGTGAITEPSTNITVNAAATQQLTVFNPPSTVTAGVPVTLRVAATDAFGNVDDSYTGAVTVISNDSSAVLESGSSLGDDGTPGEVMLTIDMRTAGPQMVTFSLPNINDPGNPFVTVVNLTVEAAAATTFTVTRNPVSTQLPAGSAITINVAAFDIFGNPATGYTGPVVLTVNNDPQATLPGPFTLTSGVGSAQITLRTAGPQTITARDQSNASINGTVGVTITPAGLSSYVVTGPTTVVTGTIQTYTARAVDQFGNVITNYNGTGLVTITDVEGSAPNTFPIVNGVGTFDVQLRTFGTQTITASDIALPTADGSIAVNVTPVPPPPPPVSPPPAVSPPPGGGGGGNNGGNFPPPGNPLPSNPASLPPVFTVSLGDEVVNRVQLYNQSGQVISQMTAYEQGFSGGARTTTARTPNGVTVVAVPGPGRQIDVRVFDPVTGFPVQSFLAFEVSFTGGAFVSTADIDGDGYDDYAISPDEGGGPRVKIISGRTGQILVDFFGIDDPNFRGGARTAMGDVNGDGIPDLIVAAGFGGGPRVAVWDGKSLMTGNPTRLTSDFFAFEPGLRNGVYVAVGDLDGDGKAEVITGAGPGGGPRVVAFSGDALLNNLQAPVVDFFAGNVDNRGGIRVAAVNLDNDNLVDLVVGDGDDAGSRVTTYLGSTIRLSNPPAAALGFDELPGYSGGVFVG